MGHEISLPPFRTEGAVALETSLARRRSVREFSRESLSLEEASQLLWSAQGMTGSGTRRTAPSAGALYPLETYLVAGRVENLAAGVYRYRPSRHRLLPVAEGDRRRMLSRAALEQACVSEAPAAIVLTAVKSRTAQRYGRRALRYVVLEAGCAAQNVSLQAVALGLGSVHVGAFDDMAVSALLDSSEEEEPLLLISIGRPLAADDRFDAVTRSHRHQKS